MTSTGADVDLRDYQKGHCQLKNGAFARWTPSALEKCQYIPHTFISGTATLSHFLNDERTLPLTFDRNQSFSSCGKTGSIQSHQGLVFRFQSLPESRRNYTLHRSRTKRSTRKGIKITYAMLECSKKGLLEVFVVSTGQHVRHPEPEKI